MEFIKSTLRQMGMKTMVFLLVAGTLLMAMTSQAIAHANACAKDAQPDQGIKLQVFGLIVGILMVLVAAYLGVRVYLARRGAGMPTNDAGMFTGLAGTPLTPMSQASSGTITPISTPGSTPAL